MTTNIVVSITDEMLNELEEICRKKAFTCCGNQSVGGEYMGSQEMVCCGEPESTEKDISWPAEEILELVNRLRAAETDAKRYRWLRDRYFAADFHYGGPYSDTVEAMVFKMPDGSVFTASCDVTIDRSLEKGL